MIVTTLRSTRLRPNEPRQGTIAVDADSRYLSGARAFWRLDEDPSAQGFDKAGFWIWGLFEEPKYPFLLLQLELSQPIPLVAGEIPAGTIYGQVTPVPPQQAAEGRWCRAEPAARRS